MLFNIIICIGKYIDCLNFSFFVGGKFYSFVTVIYILPFGLLNSDFTKSNIVVILVEI